MWRTSSLQWVSNPMRGHEYEGVMSKKRIATSRHPHLYVMVVLSGARVVRVL